MEHKSAQAVYCHCAQFVSLQVSHWDLMKHAWLSLQTKSTPETSHRQDIQLWIGGMHKVLYHTQWPEEAHSHTHWGEAIQVSISIITTGLTRSIRWKKSDTNTHRQLSKSVSNVCLSAQIQFSGFFHIKVLLMVSFTVVSWELHFG